MNEQTNGQTDRSTDPSRKPPLLRAALNKKFPETPQDHRTRQNSRTFDVDGALSGAYYLRLFFQKGFTLRYEMGYFRRLASVHLSICQSRRSSSESTHVCLR